MKLFIGNCTKKHQDFYYRVPGDSLKNVHDKIRIEHGCQVQIPGDHSRVVLDNLLAPFLKYGYKEASAISRNHAYVGMCYSFDKPISESIMSYQFEANEGVQDGAAREEMVKFAVAAAKPLIGAQPYGEPQLKKMDVCVEDVREPGAPNKAITADGVSVDSGRPEAAPRKRARG